MPVLDLHQQAWLKSLGIDDEPVVHCDMTTGQVILADGRTRQTTEVWSRCMGYHRPRHFYNPGKRQEALDRVGFKMPGTCL